MEYKRLNLRVAKPLYDKIKAYCDSIGAPLGSTMCQLADAQINNLNATAFVAQGSVLMEQMQNIMKSIPHDYTVSDPDLSSNMVDEQRDLAFLEHISSDF